MMAPSATPKLTPCRFPYAQHDGISRHLLCNQHHVVFLIAPSFTSSFGGETRSSKLTLPRRDRVPLWSKLVMHQPTSSVQRGPRFMPKDRKICSALLGSFGLCSQLAYITMGTLFEGMRKMTCFVAHEGFPPFPPVEKFAKIGIITAVLPVLVFASLLL